MAKVIAIMNEKGGVGKSATATTLARVEFGFGIKEMAEGGCGQRNRRM